MADGILLGQAAVRQLAQMVSEYNREYANEGRQTRRQPVIHSSDGDNILRAVLLADIAASQLAPAVKAIRYNTSMIVDTDPTQGGVIALPSNEATNWIYVVNFHDTAFPSGTKITVATFAGSLWQIIQANCAASSLSNPP